MRHFPIFLDMRGKKVVFSGAGETAEAKIRLLLKTEAEILVFGRNRTRPIAEWARRGRLVLIERVLGESDVEGATLVYGANDDAEADQAAVTLGRVAGALTNIVDNLDSSEFITPAIVDRDPVTVAIGTQGTAPVLARRIKAKLEEILPISTGVLAMIADRFRDRVSQFPDARMRRDFWSRFFDDNGPRAHGRGGAKAVEAELEAMLAHEWMPRPVEEKNDTVGHVVFVGAGPGDPDLLTLKARKALHEAEIILHDALVSRPVLELVRREAQLINVGKRGFSESWKQEDINALLVRYAAAGGRVVRLKSGDPAVLGRLDEETHALTIAGIGFEIVPGITAAVAAASAIGVSLTRRGRNSALTVLTGHDMKGFADHDWTRLAEPGATAAIYMGLKAMRFIAGRLMMHGADADTPVTICANVSRPDQQIVASRLADLPSNCESAAIDSPAVILLGLKPEEGFVALGSDTLRELDALHQEAV